MKALSARVAAAKAIAEVISGRSLNVVAPELRLRTRATERPFSQELIFGTLREEPRLSALVSAQLKKPLKTKDHDIFALMLLGLYQLLALRVPEHAAVSETVEAARQLKKPWATGLINGVLRNCMRHLPCLEATLTEAERKALPRWLWDVLQLQWPNQAEAIATASRSHPPMTLRVNNQRESTAHYLRRLDACELAGHEDPEVTGAVVLSTATDVGKLPGFTEGIVSVQDASAQCAAPLLAPKTGEYLLDACAAPGGKTGHLLELAPGAQLTATDISTQRLERIRENLQRLGVTATIVAGDAARAVDQWGHEVFDGILADVPCSATGVLRRNPDVKCLRTPQDIEGFATQQLAILNGLWPCLKPGGRLLYVTCSILREENDEVIERALAQLECAVLKPITVAGAVPCQYGWQRLPSAQGGDGLYFCLLVKEAA